MGSFFKNIEANRYPSLEELNKIQDKFPILHRFGFKDQWGNEQIQNKLIDGNIRSYNKLNHLHEWDKLLADRIVDLTTAYVYVLVHSNRGVPRNANEYNSKKDIRGNYNNLKFYFTYLHYILISIVDNILQIINVYFDLELKEKKVMKDPIINGLNKKDILNVAECINTFYSEFNKHSNLRNALAHRFSPYIIDRRSKLDENNPDNKITLRVNNDFADYKTEIKIIEEAFDSLRSFMNELSNEFKYQ